MSGRIVKPTEFLEMQSRLHKRNTEQTRNDEATKASIASGYTGGDPTILLPGESAASSSTKKVVVPIGYGFAHASDEIVVLPIGNDYVVMGVVRSANTGLADNGAYYLLPNGTAQPETVTTFASTAANGTRAVRINIPAPLTVASMVVEVVGSTASAVASFGLYSVDSTTTQVLYSGTVDCSTNGVKPKTISPAVYVPPAWYWYAWAINDTTTTLRAGTTVGANLTGLLNSGTVQRGSAANGASAGALPATIGAVSDLAFASVPFCKLQA